MQAVVNEGEKDFYIDEDCSSLEKVAKFVLFEL